jgi:hypothetical protein
MKNPFDQNFFKFLLGFSFILSVSFAVLFVVVQYSSTIDGQQGVVAEK